MEPHGVIEVYRKGPMDAYVAKVIYVDHRQEFASVEIEAVDAPEGIVGHTLDISRACTFVRGVDRPRLGYPTKQVPRAGEYLVCVGYQDEDGQLVLREFGWYFEHSEVDRMMKAVRKAN